MNNKLNCEFLFVIVSAPTWSDSELGSGPLEEAFHCLCCGRMVSDVSETIPADSAEEEDDVFGMFV